MARTQCSLHGQQYQSSQLFIHWSVRLVVPHTEHLRLSSGTDLLTACQMPQTRSPMKMRTTIPVMMPLRYNDFHVGRGVRSHGSLRRWAREPTRPLRSDSTRLTEILCAFAGSHPNVRAD
jgi:hypothetical protein